MSILDISYFCFWTVVGFFILRTLICFYIRYRGLCSLSKRIAPLIPMHPVFGALFQVHDMEKFFNLNLKLVQESKVKMFHMWFLFLYPIFVVCHPETVKKVLKSSTPKSKFDSTGAYKHLIPWLGDGLIMSDGKKWERNRKMLTSAFHFEILQSYLSVFNEEADIFLNTLQENMVGGKSFEVESLITNATLDTMLRCSFSKVGYVTQNGRKHPYGYAIEEIMSLALERIRQPWYYLDFIYKYSPPGRRFYKSINFIHNYDKKLIIKRRDQLKRNPDILKKKRLDFLDILLTVKDQYGQGLSNKEIQMEVANFLFAGHDTTATALSWSLYCLGKYPDEQQKLYEEVRDIMNDDADIKWEHFVQLKRQSMFIKEVQRMYSIIPIIGRYTNEPIQLNGNEIPEGCTVYVSIHALHHHPDCWPDHEEFRPDRFSEESCNERDPYAFVPFSAGPRNCIGQNFALNEIKVFLSKIIRRYKVILDEDHRIRLWPNMVMRTKYGIKIKLEKRIDPKTI